MNNRVYRFILIFFLLFRSVMAFPQIPQVCNLKCSYAENPLGMDAARPVLSWEIKSNEHNVMQSAWRILVSDNAAALESNNGNIWDSGKVPSSASIQVEYKGKKLLPDRRYYWKVMVWDNHGHSSAWSLPAYWQTGLFADTDWKGAKWIAYEDLPLSRRVLPAKRNKDNPEPPASRDILPLLRKEFTVKKAVKSAVMYISGLGQFEMSINGKKVGDHFLDPGWTDYEDQALYVTFDVTGELKKGSNALGVMLGNGFFHIPKERYKKLINSYGYPKMIARLSVKYQDGSTEDIVSDSQWTTAPGPVTYSSIYGGEDYDARLEQAGWDTPDFRENSTWKHAIIVDGPPSLQSQSQPPVKIFENFKPVKVTHPGSGSYVYDLGQNASGIVSIRVKGNKGDSIKLIPGELTDKDGFVTQKNTGGPYYLIYILKGEGVETWQPRFTYYGFRYVQVEGAAPQAEITRSNKQQSAVILELRGLHTRNSAPRVGYFSCSSELFNRTEKLIDWAIKSNTQSVFTDCPHREKLGWLEEDHLVGSSLHYQYDIAGLSRKVVKDMELAQTPEGLVPEIAPEYTVFSGGFRDSPEWGSNCIIFPWYLYQWYGDRQLLEQAYPMMKRYLDYLGSTAKDHILYQGLGDWYDLGPDRPGFSQLTPKGVTGTAIYYYDLNIVARIAEMTGKPEDARAYRALGEEVRNAFNKTFFNNDTKRYATGSQAANAMAVYMGLVKPEDKAAVVANLVADIRAGNNRLTAGDIGFRYLLRVLSEEGYSDVIYDMNNRADVPGYGYQLEHGATALTESWQASPAVSNNHFMLGHILEWFYDGLGGIRNAEGSVAYKVAKIYPEPVGGITSAKASFHSPYGLIVSSWKIEKDRFELTAEVPANTEADIWLPSAAGGEIFESGKRISNSKNYRVKGYENGRVVVNVGSGTYHFSTKMPARDAVAGGSQK